MENMHFVLMVATVCCMGCRTPQSSQSQRSQSVLAAILAEHHFAPPTVIRGTHGIMWGVAARPHSDAAVELAQIEMPPDGRATVKIVSYQYGPSDWAILGNLFTADHPNQEASVMQSAIRDRLVH